MTKVYRDVTYTPSAVTNYAYAKARDAEAAAGPGSSSPVADAEATHEKRLGEWPSFVRDVFGRLFRPQDARDRSLPSGRVEPWASKAVTALEQHGDFAELQVAARAHRGIAGAAAATLADAVAKEMGIDKLSEGGDAAVDPRAAERRVRRLAEETEEESDEETAKEIQDAARDAADAWGRSLARRRALAGKADDAGMAKRLGKALASATETAKKAAEAIAVLVGAGIGAGGGGEDNEIPDDLVRLVMADANVAAILEKLGAIQRAERTSEMKPVGQGKLDVVGVTMGNDPLHLVSSELAMLGHPALRVEVLSRLVDGGALVSEQRGEEPSNRGDFVELVDRSGSMSGEPIQWARAIALAMMLRALREKRRVIVVMFDHDVSATVEVRPGDNKALAAAIRALLMEAGGGTDAVKACRAARARLSPREKDRVDTVIITDGIWTANAADVAALRRSGGTFRGVLVGAGAQSHSWLDGAWRVEGTDEQGALICNELFGDGKKKGRAA